MSRAVSLPLALLASVILTACAGQTPGRLASAQHALPTAGDRSPVAWRTDVLKARADEREDGASEGAWTTAFRPVQRDRSPKPGPLPKGGGYYKVGKPYRIKGKLYTPRVDPGYDRTGIASWYGPGFHGKLTANGETYDQHALTAAHPTLPLPSYAHVTNLENGRTVLVRINDRGPFRHNRILDASLRVAKELGFQRQGTARVRVKYVGRAPLDGDDSRERTHLASRDTR